MVDVLSNGRLEGGFVRGVPYEIMPANSNPVRMNERQWEAMDLIVKAWTTHDGPFSHEGRFFHHRNINIWPRPLSTAASADLDQHNEPGGAQRVGAHGYIQATFLTGFERHAGDLRRYRKGWREAGRGKDVPVDRLAYAAMVYVAPKRGQRHVPAPRSCCGTCTANKVPPHLPQSAGLHAGSRAMSVMLRGGGRPIQRVRAKQHGRRRRHRSRHHVRRHARPGVSADQEVLRPSSAASGIC